MEYKKELHKNYLILNGQGEEAKHYSMQMLSQNEVPCMLPLKVQQLNNEVSYLYDITTVQSIKEYAEKNLLGKELISKIFCSILEQIEVGKKFLLNEDDFVFLPDSIFLDSVDTKVYFCYCNKYQKSVKEQITYIIEYFLDSVNYEDKGAVLLVFSLYKTSKEECAYQKFRKIMNEQEDFSYDNNREIEFVREDSLLSKHELNDKENIDSIKNLENKQELDSKDKLIYAEKSDNSIIEENLLWQAKETKKGKYPLWVWGGSISSVIICLAVLIIAVMKGYLVNQQTGELYLIKMVLLFGLVGLLEVGMLSFMFQEKHKSKNTEIESNEKREEQVYWHEEETVVLRSSEEEGLYLIPFNTKLYQEILIIEFPFFIGKLGEKVDAKIESHSISRYHARIDKQNNEFYITDLNSTNGTFLNGQRLKSNEKQKIELEDEIEFANLKYKLVCK